MLFLLPVHSQNKGLHTGCPERSFPARARARLLRARTSHVSARDRFFIDDPALPCDVVVYHEWVIPEFSKCLGRLNDNIDRHADSVQIPVEFHGEFAAVFYPMLDDADIIVAFTVSLFLSIVSQRG